MRKLNGKFQWDNLLAAFFISSFVLRADAILVSCSYSILLILSIAALGISVSIHFQSEYVLLLDRETLEQVDSLESPSLSRIGTLLGLLATLLILCRVCCKRCVRCSSALYTLLLLACIVVELYVNIDLLYSPKCQEEYICAAGMGGRLSLAVLPLWIVCFILSFILSSCCNGQAYSPVVSRDGVEMVPSSTGPPCSEVKFVRPIMDGGFSWDGKLEHMIPVDAIPIEDDDDQDFLDAGKDSMDANNP